MRSLVEKFRRKVFWTFGQPLYRRPEQVGDPVSDLFVWRNSEDWKTFFELIDIAGLFDGDESVSGRSATILFFDNNGEQFLDHRFDLLSNERQTIDLTEFVTESKSSSGTFCIFHTTPQVVSDLGSFIAERGYVSYKYKEAPLRSYVHGNLDAICLSRNKGLRLLCSSSFFPREYRLQYELSGSELYEVGIVNPSSRDQIVTCQVLCACNGARLVVQEVRLRPRASHVFFVQVEAVQPVRVVISSHLIMARPLVFRIHQQKMIVFHG
jgi:hypothetical protein